MSFELGDGDSSLGWRRRLLEGLLRTTFVLMTIVLPVVVVQTRSYVRVGWTSLVVLTYAIVALGCAVRRLPYVLRTLSLLFGLALISWLGLVRVGYQAGPGVGSALVVVTAGLLLGRKALVAAYAVMLGGWLAMGAIHAYGGVHWLAKTSGDPTQLSNWVRVVCSLGLFTGVLSVAVMFVVSRIEGMLLTRTRALEQLQVEQSQREEAQRALVRANLQLAQMQKLEALGRLAGGVAHDFNNALMVVLGWTDLLRRRPMSDEALDAGLDQISTAASGAARLTHQLLSFGRKAVHVRQSVRLSDVIARVIEALSCLVPKNVQIHCELVSDVPPVLADPEQIYQMLMNLCINARDAMPDGGCLTIGLREAIDDRSGDVPAGDWLVLTVCDTGVGMDEETLKNAFEPFFTTKGQLGSGLGLASVYGIVQQSGGHVSVQSAVGKGTVFRVLLPREPLAFLPMPGGMAGSAPMGASDTQAVATILVAEDEPVVRRLIVGILESEGHRVVAADCGSAALELARRHRGVIDLLCTDGVMPGMSSEHLVAGFRQLFPGAPVLLCSGALEVDAVREAVESQCVRYLPKPFTHLQLAGAVRAALGRAEPNAPRPAEPEARRVEARL